MIEECNGHLGMVAYFYGEINLRCLDYNGKNTNLVEEMKEHPQTWRDYVVEED